MNLKGTPRDQGQPAMDYILSMQTEVLAIREEIKMWRAKHFHFQVRVFLMGVFAGIVATYLVLRFVR